MSMTRVSVPFVDLRPSHDALKAAILTDIEELLDSGAFVNGYAVAAFEREFAAYVGARECVGMASGLDALRLALVAAGIEWGREHGLHKLTLSVFPHNEAALALYRKFGFAVGLLGGAVLLLMCGLGLSGCGG